MLLMLLTAEECGDSGGSSYSQQEYDFQNIENEFTVDELDEATLNAFEKRAIQKLKDLADYINVFADTAYSAEFRIQARQMINELFISDEDVHKFFEEVGFKEDSVEQLLFIPKEMDSFRVDAVVVSKSFLQNSNGVYSAELSYIIHAGENALEGQLKIVAEKEAKQFGNTSTTVWSLYFDH